MIKAWHFTGETLRNGDPIPAIGEPLVYDGPVKICESGLHASRRIIDALKYAPGWICRRVWCEELVDEHGDKLVCRRRTIEWSVNAEEVLRRFARRCAFDVAHLWDCPHVVREYLYTGREELRTAAEAAARAAASAAAWTAAAAAARAAASAVAWAAAAESEAESAAARAAASSASWSAAAAAARAAELVAAESRQNRRLTAMINNLKAQKRGNSGGNAE